MLDIKNACLLSKWLFKLLSEDGVWQELLRNKYLTQHTLSEVKAKPTDSPFWKGRLRVKDQFFNSFKLGMESPLGFGRIFGCGMVLFNINIRTCIIFFNGEM